MKNSKFIDAYLKIINEENEMAAAAAAPEVDTVATDDGKQCVCFKTSDKNLIDAINSGFDEVVFFVKAKDEATGEDTVTEVKFGPESFEGLEIKAAEAVDGEACPECGEDPCTCECGGINGECGGENPNGPVEETLEEGIEEGGDGGADPESGDGGDVPKGAKRVN